MAHFVKRMFKLNLFVLRLLGFYPSRQYTQIYRFYAYTVYCFCTIPVPILAALYLLTGENVDLTQVGDSSFIIFELGCYIFKMIPFIFNAAAVRKTIYNMEWPIFHQYLESQEAIMVECIEICKRNTWLFLSFASCSFTTWSFAPFFGNGHKFPIEIWVPFDETANVILYISTYLFVCIGVGYGAFSNGVLDPLVSGLAVFAATQMKVLKNSLEHLGDYTDEQIQQHLQHSDELNLKNKKVVESKIMYDRIKHCINHHNAILEYVKQYEDIYSLAVFSQFTASVLVICVSCLQLSLIEPFTFTFFSMISFLLTMLLEIYLYCYYGSILYEESNTLSNAICMGNWYEYDMESKKALIVLIERSKVPLVVTAGKILDLSLVTFTTILRRAYSLLAVLKNYKKS